MRRPLFAALSIAVLLLWGAPLPALLLLSVALFPSGEVKPVGSPTHGW